MEIPSSPLTPRLPDAKLWRATVGDVVEALQSTGQTTPSPSPTDAADAVILRDITPASQLAATLRDGPIGPPILPLPPGPALDPPGPSHADVAAARGTDQRGPVPADDAPPLPPPLRFAADAARASLAAGRPMPALALLDAAWPASEAPAELHALRAQGLLDVGRETESAEVVARGLAQAPASSALRWLGVQAAVRLDAPAHAAALALPLLRQVPNAADGAASSAPATPAAQSTPASSSMSSTSSAPASPSRTSSDETGVPAKARVALREMAQYVVAVGMPVVVAAKVDVVESAAPMDLTVLEAEVLTADVEVAAVDNAAREGIARAVRGDGAPTVPPALSGDSHLQAEQILAAGAPERPATAMSSKSADTTAARSPAMPPSDPAAPLEVLSAEPQALPAQHAAGRAATPAGELAVPQRAGAAPVIIAPEAVPTQQAIEGRAPTPDPSAPTGRAATPTAVPVLAPTAPAEPSAPRGAAPGAAAAPPPRSVLYEQRRTAVLTALERVLGPAERRLFASGDAIRAVERWLAPITMRDPMQQAAARMDPRSVEMLPRDVQLRLLQLGTDESVIVPLPAATGTALLPAASAHAGVLLLPPVGADGHLVLPTELGADGRVIAPGDAGVEHGVPLPAVPHHGASLPSVLNHETQLALRSPDISNEAGRESKISETTATPLPREHADPRTLPLMPPPSDPSTLFAWLAVDARLQPAGVLAAQWRRAGEGAVLHAMGSAAAARRAPLPVSWQGVLRLALVGAAIVSVTVGRSSTAVVLAAAAVAWWLQDGRRR